MWLELFKSFKVKKVSKLYKRFKVRYALPLLLIGMVYGQFQTRLNLLRKDKEYYAMIDMVGFENTKDIARVVKHMCIHHPEISLKPTPHAIANYHKMIEEGAINPYVPTPCHESIDLLNEAVFLDATPDEPKWWKYFIGKQNNLQGSSKAERGLGRYHNHQSIDVLGAVRLTGLTRCTTREYCEKWYGRECDEYIWNKQFKNSYSYYKHLPKDKRYCYRIEPQYM